MLFLQAPAKHRNIKIILGFLHNDLDLGREVTSKPYCEPTVRMMFDVVVPQIALFNLLLLLQSRSWAILIHLSLCQRGFFLFFLFF